MEKGLYYSIGGGHRVGWDVGENGICLYHLHPVIFRNIFGSGEDVECEKVGNSKKVEVKEERRRYELRPTSSQCGDYGKDHRRHGFGLGWSEVKQDD